MATLAAFERAFAFFLAMVTIKLLTRCYSACFGHLRNHTYIQLLLLLSAPTKYIISTKRPYLRRGSLNRRLNRIQSRISYYYHHRLDILLPCTQWAYSLATIMIIMNILVIIISYLWRRRRQRDWSGIELFDKSLPLHPSSRLCDHHHDNNLHSPVDLLHYHQEKG